MLRSGLDHPRRARAPLRHQPRRLNAGRQLRDTRRHQWREGDVARLAAAAARLGLPGHGAGPA